MTTGLRAAWLAFAITILLVLFVSITGYRTARDTLADEFAQEAYLVSLYTARHIQSKFDTAGLCLKLLGASEIRQSAARRDALLGVFRTALDDSLTTIQALGPTGEVTAGWYGFESPQPAAMEQAWEDSRHSGRPVPAFARDRDGHSLMVVAESVGRREQPTGGTALTMRLESILTPPGLEPEERVEILVVEPTTLAILASTRALPADSTLDGLFEVESETFWDTVRGLRGGAKERNARGQPDSGWHDDQAYLLGVQPMLLGGRPLVVTCTAPRAQLVEGYLHRIGRWIVVLGLVVIVALGCFVAMMLRSQATAEQERQRSGERNSLLKISLALLSERRLTEVLQRIADEARALFGAEGATIALVDEASAEIVFSCVSSNRADVLAKLSGLRLPKDNGIIGWCIREGESVRVADPTRDDRFAGIIDQQTGSQTKSVLCAPLRDQKGQAFGAIELVNSVDNPFPESDLVLLQHLAVTASAAVERGMYQEREVEQQRLQREMEIARTVQEGLLPREMPKVAGFDFHGITDPAREVGGDFFDFIPIGPHHLGVVIADVADKGLGAAMFMVMCRSLLYTLAHRERSPAKVLLGLNRRILEVSTSNLFVTVFYGVLDTRSGTFTYTNAGHNPPYLYRCDGAIETITTDGIALGVIEPIELVEDTLDLAAGDRLVMYTDGVTEAINPAEEQFGTAGLRAVLQASDGLAAESTTKAIVNAVSRHVGEAAQFDDITLTVIHANQHPTTEADWREDAKTRG